LQFFSGTTRPNLNGILRVLKNNPAAILIIACQILFLACIGLFSNGQIASSELLSSVAYFLLLAGVIVELILVFLKWGISSD